MKTTRNILLFIIPSLVGILLFMTPVLYNGSVTIPVAILAKILLNFVGSIQREIVTILIAVSSVLSLIFTTLKPTWLKNNSFIKSIFVTTIPWLIIRVIGAIFVLLTYFNIGPEAIYSGSTGGLLLNDLLTVLFSVFIFAGLFLPLLLNFGLLEFFGTLLTKIMHPLFKLPGRAAIDCITSWLGDGTVGVMLTNSQYEDGIYTQREAAVVGTTFSAVSITFSMVVITQVGLEHLFVPFYLTTCAAGIVAAIIIPRIPPLNKKRDTFISGEEESKNDEAIPTGKHLVSYGFELSLKRVSKIKNIGSEMIHGCQIALEMLFGVLPVVMGIGTLALILAEYTPLFNILGVPFIPFLKLLQIPEAEAAAGTIIVGFADMFIPSILATSIQSELTRFIIAALSVTQLIYMSEVGALLLGSKIPVKFWELFVIFLLRTVITLPVITLLAHFVIG
ncbi:YjiH family protein [Thiospirochaeta perfilievii]|uniref:YjiH family protein n=1 Tax=Thiospirochaeta perfilievii TaxID=252967 RepID=A0A5C1Q858_9SPIO|nr:YjiH family protein [Thiospirochaeta perfilievii]QEN03661.1 YjiH family protein [Thiospirochaeta perfilievii]